MRKLALGVVAVLVMAGMAQAYQLGISSATVPIGTPSVNLDLTIKGNETLLISVVADLTSDGPLFSGMTAKSGVFATSTQPLAVAVFSSSNGGKGAHTDYGMSFFDSADFGGQGFPSLNSNGQVYRTLQLGLTGLGMGTYHIGYLPPPNGGTGAVFDVVGSLEAQGYSGGTVTITPEPAAMILLALGGLFLRRRTA